MPKLVYMTDTPTKSAKEGKARTDKEELVASSSYP
jgi:hypothetical protein